jgi:NAD(P)-dependent dehydrogenase (short-subunit alcohol dehydrogenase family)
MLLELWYFCIDSLSSVSDAFKKTKETFGTIDIVVNNAGILADDRWEREIKINVVRDHSYEKVIHIFTSMYRNSHESALEAKGNTPLE